MGILRRILTFPLPFYFVVSTILMVAAAAVVSMSFLVYTLQGGNKGKAVGDTLVRFSSASLETLRGVVRVAEVAATGANPDVVRPVTSATDRLTAAIDGNGFGISGPRGYMAAEAQPGWRLVLGIFDIEGEPRRAMLALDDDLAVRHLWRLHEDGVDAPEKQGAAHTFPHGITVLPDGSVVFAFDNGVSLRRFDVCGRETWTRIGNYHHAVQADESGEQLWTLRGVPPDLATLDDATRPTGDKYDATAAREHVVQIDAADGRILRTFSLRDVMEANPHLDVLGIRQIGTHHADSWRWAPDPFHPNDVDPLPPSLAAAFPGFESGDLLLSYRSINLVMVVDPQTLRIRWHRMGMARRQHDPDWTPDGNIRVYDNNSTRGPSRIIDVDPRDFEVKTVLDGGNYDFYSSARGKHQRLPDGSILLVSSYQGRALEVDPEGRVTFEFLNNREDNDDRVYMLSDAQWFSKDYFEFDSFPECEATVAQHTSR
jgi:hypothetical protein